MRINAKLISIIFMWVLLPATGQVWAGQAVTQANYLACRKITLLDQAVAYARSGQYGLLQPLLKNNQCIATQDDVPVVVLDNMERDGKVVFVYKGWRFWIQKEGLKGLQ